MRNLETSFEIKANDEYKKMTRRVAKIIYKGDKLLRVTAVCDAAATILGMLFITLLCVKFYFRDLDCLLADYGYEDAARLPYFAWVGAFLAMLYGTGLRPRLLVRTLMRKANYAELGSKSIILTEEFFIQKSAFGEGRYFYDIISDARKIGKFAVIIIANSAFIAVPLDAFSDDGDEFLQTIRVKAGLAE